MIIYKITNKINGKCYIGQTVQDFHKRISQHKSDSLVDSTGMPIHRAIKKYGWDNFVCEIICECSDIDDLNDKEIQCITECGSMVPSGYNICEGGKSGGKRIFTDEHIENLKAAQQKRSKDTWGPLSEGTKQKMSDAKKGAKREQFSDEWLENMSIAQRGENNPMYGKTHSEEAKRKISEKLRGRKPKPITEETRQKLREASSGENNWNYGKTTPAAVKQKISESLKGEKNGFHGKTHSEETKRKMKEAWKRRKEKKKEEDNKH